MIEWMPIKISDLGKVVTGNTPPRKNPEYYGNHTIFIKPTDISENEKYTYKPDECYSDLGFRKYKNSLIPTGSTCVVTIGSIGKKITKAHCDCFINQAMNAVIPNDNFDQEFVFYVLKYNLGQLKMLDSGTASGRENVSKSSFANVKIYVPKNKDVQNRIGKTLSAYDDLIENNQKRIKLLEETIQLVYEITSNHKDVKEKLVYPEYCNFIKGSEPGSDNYTDNNIDKNTPFLRVGDLGARNSEIFVDSKLNGLKFTKKDDILVSLDGTIGIVRIGMEGAYSSGIRKVVCNNSLIKGFTYAFLKSINGQNQIKTYAKGSTILHASSAIPKLKFMIAINSDTEVLLNELNSMLVLIINLTEQNDKLKQSRDILLPRLMSGKINLES